jgi:hypothetical protein
VPPSCVCSRCYKKKVGLFHFEWHVLKSIVPRFFPVIFSTLVVLYSLSALDATVRYFTPWSELLQLVERGVHSSQLEMMVADGQYPTVGAIRVDGGVDVDRVLDAQGAYVEGKVASGDVVTAATASLLRYLHECGMVRVAQLLRDRRQGVRRPLLDAFLSSRIPFDVQVPLLGADSDVDLD